MQYIVGSTGYGIIVVVFFTASVKLVILFDHFHFILFSKPGEVFIAHNTVRVHCVGSAGGSNAVYSYCFPESTDKCYVAPVADETHC